MLPYFVTISDEESNKLLSLLNDIEEDVHFVATEQRPIVYTRDELLEKLQISKKQLDRYRYDGLLPYTRVGGKYWFTQANLDTFLNRHRCESFATWDS